MSNVEQRADADLLVALPHDLGAFEAFYERYVDRVTAFAARRCSCAGDVADVVAQTFVRLLEVADRSDPTRVTPARSSSALPSTPRATSIVAAHGNAPSRRSSSGRAGKRACRPGRHRRGRQPPPRWPGHWRYESAQWLAARLATDLVELPGGHMGYLGDPPAFAQALRPVLRVLA
jgi:hypothetical protein